MTGKDSLPEKDLLEEAATLKRLQYSSLGKELKAQTDIVNKQYQELNKSFKSDEQEVPITIKKEKQTIKKCNRSDLICNSKYRFYKYYRDSKKFNNLSYKSKYSFLAEFFNDLDKLIS